MARSRSWDRLLPGLNDPPAVSYGQHAKGELEYISALSWATTPTGHMAYLTMERSKEVEAKLIKGRVTKPIDVAYLAVKNVDCDTHVKRLPLKSSLLGLIPVTVSVVTCVMCALIHDWYSFSTIFIGIISNGCATLIIGKGRLVIKSVKNTSGFGASPGHGVLMGEDEIVVIKAEVRDVSIITDGRFHLETQGDEEKGTVSIGACSLLFVIQFLVQLLLVPQGSLFGQIMFLVSLGASWGYNSYLSSVKENIQMRILFQALGHPEMLRFRTGTRTTMAVFVCLLLGQELLPGRGPRSSCQDPPLVSPKRYSRMKAVEGESRPAAPEH